MSNRAFITDSARKHGVDDADIWHAFRNAVTQDRFQEDGMDVRYGYDSALRLIEIGFVTRHDGTHVIIHALRRRRLPTRP